MRNIRIVVDANIIFSGLLNTNSKIGDLLINSEKHFNFIAPEFLRTEIKKHRAKILKYSGMTSSELLETEFQIYRRITFISEDQIGVKVWKSAEKITNDIDPKDIVYVAFSKHFRCRIWSGDKSLIKGLSKKGFKQFITTNELFDLREEFF